MNHEQSKGFTLIELLLVIAIISSLLASAGPSLTRLLAVNNLEVAQDEVVGSIRKAQNYAMTGRDDATWGVCLFSGDVRLYRGSCTIPSYFEDYNLSGVAVLGLTDIAFSGATGKRGEPSTTAEVTLSNDFGSSNIDLNAAGGMEIN